MRVSNIKNTVNFGKTVRVCLPEDDVISLVKLINLDKPSFSFSKAQQDAKAIFDDVKEGKAVVYKAPNGDAIYILSGKEAIKLDDIKKKSLNVLETVCDFYDEGQFLEDSIVAINKKTASMIDELIKNTREKFYLGFKNADDGASLCKIGLVG